MTVDTLVELMDSRASDSRPFLISPDTGAQLSFQRFREEAHRVAEQIAGEGIEQGDREPRPYEPAFCRSCPARSYCPKASEHPEPFTKAQEARPETQRLLF